MIQIGRVGGRLGGDEFGTILSHTDEANAKEKAQFLADKIAEFAGLTAAALTTLKQTVPVPVDGPPSVQAQTPGDDDRLDLVAVAEAHEFPRKVPRGHELGHIEVDDERQATVAVGVKPS
mgnify:CR=1 FL=1